MNGATDKNPEVRASRLTEKAAQREVRQVVGELVPTVFLEGTVLHQEERSSKASSLDRAEVSIQLQVPLFQQGQVSSRVREAKQTASQRRIQVAETQRKVKEEAVAAWGELQGARGELREVEQEVAAAARALRGVEEEERVGARTILDVLDAEQELFTARSDLARAKRDLVVAGYRVLETVGRLTARDLKLDVQYYDAKEPFNDVRDEWFSLDAPEVRGVDKEAAQE